MGERNLERFAVGVVIAVILALTPIIPWVLETVGVTTQWWAKYVVRIVTGLLLYVIAMYAVSGLSDDDTVEVEGGDPGKLTINKGLFIVGVIVIAIGWLTDISSYIVQQFNLTWWVNLGGTTYKISNIPERLIIAVFTFAGAILIKYSISRKEREEMDFGDTSDIYERTKRRAR